MRLLFLCCVGILLEMLMYWRVHSAFSQNSALPKAKIHYFYRHPYFIWESQYGNNARNRARLMAVPNWRW